MPASTSPLCLLIDGHSLAFRAFYAHAKGADGGLRTSGGVPTSVCFGFLKSLLQALETHKPDSLAIAFDLSAPTFRHKADANYKADRPETPEDFIPDLANLQRILGAMALPIVTASGYEADDVLATVAQRASIAGYRVKIVTGDRDLFQLVDRERQVSVLYFNRNGGTSEFGPAEVEEKLGVKPGQVVDYKALCGDKSDNIPGVRGIGEKTAVKLLTEYETLAGVYANIDRITGATQKKLLTGKEDAERSQFLARIEQNVPIEIALESYRLQGFDFETVRPILQELELTSLLRQLNRLQASCGGTVTTPVDAPSEAPQLGSFGGEDVSFFSPEETDACVPIEIVTIAPRIVDTPEKLAALVAELQTQTDPQKPVAWDTETTDLKPRLADLVGIGCCWGAAPTAVAYIPIAHTEGTNLARETVLAALKPILESKDFPKALQNAKFDRLVFHYQGIALEGVVFDPMLASYVLNPGNSNNLGDLCARYAPEIQSLSFKDLGIGRGKTIADLEIEKVAEYCGLDAYATYQLVPLLRAELEREPDLLALCSDIELPLEPVLAAMEARGIRIDLDYLAGLSEELSQKLATIEQNAYEAAGSEFNLNSPKQLSELLFETLNLDRRKSRKTKTGFSTDHATLEKLQGDHPVIDAILEHRTLSKLKSTYVDALPELADPATQRVHTDFNQAVTATGRLSSSNPNLQNIPIRTAFSRQIRKAFLPELGWTLVAADYSQIELRILAHFSQEPVLVDAYRENRDVHTVTAQLIFDKEEVTPDERRLGKTINFGVIYGMGAQRFAREAGVRSAEGKRFIDRYHARYPQVFDYLERSKKEAIARGYVETLCKRRRYFSFVGQSLQSLRGCNPDEIEIDRLRPGRVDAENLRAAANAPIQGSSADIIKIAMTKLQALLAGYRTRLLLQVHDELVFEVPAEELGEIQPLLKTTMENALTLSVPLVVDVNSGPNWMEAK